MGINDAFSHVGPYQFSEKDDDHRLGFYYRGRIDLRFIHNLSVFTLLTYASYLKWIQIVVAAITLVLGSLNLKDYFFFKEGVSLTIADEKAGYLSKNAQCC